MKGRNVIKQGAKWRIGSGRAIHIWSENWLPNSSHPKVLSPRVEGRGVNLVADLIDPVNKEWKGTSLIIYSMNLKQPLLKICLSAGPYRMTS